MARTLTTAGLTRLALVIIVLVLLALVAGCSGGSTTTTTDLTPGQTFEDQIYTLNPFELNHPEDSDANGITGSATINGIVLEEGQRPTIEIPVGTTEIQVGYAVTGHGFVLPGGSRETTQIDDLYDVTTGTQVALCKAKTAVGDLPPKESRLDILDQMSETISIEDLRTKEDRIVPVLITEAVDRKVAQRIVGTNIGIQPIPAERLVTVETKRNSSDSLLGLGLGFVLGRLLDIVVPGSGVIVEVLCGDPSTDLYANLLLKGYGDEGPVVPPPATNRPPTAQINGPTALLVNQSGTWTVTMADPDGDDLNNRWLIPGSGYPTTTSITWQFAVEGSYFISVEVSDGHVTVTETVTVNVTKPVTPPPGPSWGGQPFDQSKLVLDVEPDGPADYDGTHVIGMDSTFGEKSNPFIGHVYYDGKEVTPGQGGKYWSTSITTTASAGTLSTDWVFDSAVCGPGVFYVTIHFVIETLPDALDDLSITRRIRVD